MGAEMAGLRGIQADHARRKGEQASDPSRIEGGSRRGSRNREYDRICSSFVINRPPPLVCPQATVEAQCAALTVELAEWKKESFCLRDAMDQNQEKTER